MYVHIFQLGTFCPNMSIQMINFVRIYNKYNLYIKLTLYMCQPHLKLLKLGENPILRVIVSIKTAYNSKPVRGRRLRVDNQSKCHVVLRATSRLHTGTTHTPSDTISLPTEQIGGKTCENCMVFDTLFIIHELYNVFYMSLI